MCNRTGPRRHVRRSPGLDAHWPEDGDDLAMAAVPMTSAVLSKTPQTTPPTLVGMHYPPGLVHYSVEKGATVVPCCYNVALGGAALDGATSVQCSARTPNGLIPSSSCTQHKNIICHLDPYAHDLDESMSTYSQCLSENSGKGRGWV